MTPFRQYTQFETREKPKDANDNWDKFFEFGFRASWRIYMNAKGRECRNYRTCMDEIEHLMEIMKHQLGPRGERWDADIDYLYLYLKSSVDFAEFRLVIELPFD
jgi:hypothetical protein